MRLIEHWRTCVNISWSSSDPRVRSMSTDAGPVLSSNSNSKSASCWVHACEGWSLQSTLYLNVFVSGALLGMPFQQPQGSCLLILPQCSATTPHTALRWFVIVSNYSITWRAVKPRNAVLYHAVSSSLSRTQMSHTVHSVLHRLLGMHQHAFANPPNQ